MILVKSQEEVRMVGSDYIDIVTKTVKRAYNGQAETLAHVASLLAHTVESKRNVFVFGCSHAGIIAEEVFYRTGGLAVINPIFFPAMMLNTRPITMTRSLERVTGKGRRSADHTFGVRQKFRACRNGGGGEGSRRERRLHH